MARAYFYLLFPMALLVVLALELAGTQARVALTPARLPAAKIMHPAAPNLHVEAAVLLARPLFSPLRRPAIAAPRPAPRPPRLSGIVVTGSGSYAIFAPDGGTPMIAARGQLVGHFMIREITTTHVIVAGPDGVFTLHTSYPSGASGAARPSHGPAPIILPGGITLYPATSDNLPAAADWPGPAD